MKGYHLVTFTLCGTFLSNRIAMNIDAIDTAFADLIAKRGVYKDLNITMTHLKQLRYKLKHGQGISTDLKLQLLQRSGWRQDQAQYTRQDLVSLLKFYERTSQVARDVGPEYVVEKFLLTSLKK